MKAAFAGDPVANTLFVATLVVWLFFELRQALLRRPNATNVDRFSLMTLRVCITLGILLALFATRATTIGFGSSPVAAWFGIALMWTGIALRWCSFRTLGGYFTFSVMTSTDQPVIASGPYRLLRHPSYAGLLLYFAGVGIAFGNWLSLISLLVLPLIGLVYRIHVEENALSTALGANYTTYASRRKRIIPFVW